MPGIGPRHATRIALSMLDWDGDKRSRMLDTLKDVFDKINFCENCFFVWIVDLRLSIVDGSGLWRLLGLNRQSKILRGLHFR